MSQIYYAKRHSFKKHNNILCLIWKSQNISLNKAIEELKTNFKVVDSVISDKHVKSFVK